MAKTSKKTTKKSNYIAVIGRRRTATARVRLYSKKGDITVNDKPIAEYFPGAVSEKFYMEPFKICNMIDKYSASIKVLGSGKSGQLGAVIHGLTRALLKVDEEKFRPILKNRGLITRDHRKKERRKVGTGGKARRKRQSPKR